jgi:CDP-glucose 4,6-dehydratase
VESVVTMFWKGKKVLVTGHTGFKGGWLSLWLQQRGAEVCGYSMPAPTKPSLFEAARVAEGMRSVVGDVRELNHLKRVVEEFRPEIVFHLAAQALVRQSYKDPIETYSTNVMGTVNVLEAVRQVGGVRVVVNVTSDKCYENREWCWPYRENEAMGGYDPYSSSKGCAELVTAALRNSFFHPSKMAEHGVAVASARAGNVIGGGDWATDRLVPDMMRAFMAGEIVMVRNPNAVRPWQHVLEPLSGYLLLAEKLFECGGEFAEAWNFGPMEDDARPVSWVVGQLKDLWGEGAEWAVDRNHHPHEAQLLRLDCSKAKARMGWQARLKGIEPLVMVVDWYKAFQNGEDLQRKTLAQIAQYEKIAAVAERSSAAKTGAN